MEKNNFIKKVDRQNRFISLFNPNDGFYLRSGVFDKDGNETDEDPFMASFPELIDIGICGSCNNAKDCPVQCYQGGELNKRDHMSLDVFKNIIDQCNGKVFQVALGGHGNVNAHPDFEEMLKYCRKNNIIPNYTTSGIDLTDEQVNITKKYCGAVAISFHNKQYTYDALNKFLSAKITTNIHYVLSNSSINKAIWKLLNSDFPQDINAVIFLLHKNVGLGTKENILSPSDPRVQTFFEVVDEHNESWKIGFDSCSIPGIFNFTKNIDKNSIDGCEGSRYSMYITPDNIALPCSFDQNQKYGVDLKKYSIQEAWDSSIFEQFRSYLRHSCPECVHTSDCKICPIKPEITLCNKNEKVFKNE